jgi:hypothetical protein
MEKFESDLEPSDLELVLAAPDLVAVGSGAIGSRAGWI